MGGSALSLGGTTVHDGEPSGEREETEAQEELESVRLSDKLMTPSARVHFVYCAPYRSGTVRRYPMLKVKSYLNCCQFME